MAFLQSLTFLTVFLIFVVCFSTFECNMARRVRKRVRMVRTLNATEALSSIIQASIDQTLIVQDSSVFVSPHPKVPTPPIGIISALPTLDINNLPLDISSSIEFFDESLPVPFENRIKVESVDSHSGDELMDEAKPPFCILFSFTDSVFTLPELTSPPLSSNNPQYPSSFSNTEDPSPFRLEKDESIKLDNHDLAMI